MPQSSGLRRWSKKNVLAMTCLYRSKVSSSTCGRATGVMIPIVPLWRVDGEHRRMEVGRTNAKRRKGDITARYAKYALYGLYRLSTQIKPADKTAHAQWAYFVAVLPTGYIRTIYHRRKNALSGALAVIPSGYIRKEKPMATRAHDSDTGNQL